MSLLSQEQISIARISKMVGQMKYGDPHRNVFFSFDLFCDTNALYCFWTYSNIAGVNEFASVRFLRRIIWHIQRRYLALLVSLNIAPLTTINDSSNNGIDHYVVYNNNNKLYFTIHTHLHTNIKLKVLNHLSSKTNINNKN